VNVPGPLRASGPPRQILDSVKYLPNTVRMAVSTRHVSIRRDAQPDAQRVAAVRRFNRFYTQKLGVLQPAWLDSPFSLSEARVLYEIKQREGATASDVARDLGLDAGYMSRILRRFHKGGLIRKEVSPADRRQSFLSMTARGRKAYAPLEKRAQRDVRALLGRLSSHEQEHLLTAMRVIETMIAAKPKGESEITLRDPRPGDLGWVVARHAELYQQEYGWADNFEGVCARIVADFAANYDPKHDRGWIAEMNGQNVGCVFLAKDSAEVARLRLLLVEPLARGRGLGTRLTDECIRFARTCGYRRIALWTHQVLTPARHIYQRAGFTLTSSEAMRNFGQDVVSEHWNLVL
jgi:DNA-binding MarR family transcriptional regulator/GNAT superfamily N-acetyltransferase